MWSNEYGAWSREEWYMEEEGAVGWRSVESGTALFSLSALLGDAKYRSVEICDDDEDDDDGEATEENVVADGKVERDPHMGTPGERMGYETTDSVGVGGYIFGDECTGRCGKVPGYVAGDTFCACAELLMEAGVNGIRKCMGKAEGSGV